MAENKISLSLFFSKNTSLVVWDKGGILEREIAIYQKLVEHGISVRFVTYGGPDELAYQSNLKGIKIVCNRWNLPICFYRLYITKFAPIFWPSDTIIKSNQIKGAKIGLAAAKHSGRKFIARGGYLYSDYIEHLHGPTAPQTQETRQVESHLFENADQIVVTTSLMQQKIVKNYQLAVEKIQIIPNYVDTTHFSPRADASYAPNRLCFVGRLEPVKNLSTLLEACVGLDVELYIIGSGSLENTLKDMARKLCLKSKFFGTIPNNQLPELLTKSSAFVLPSIYEGHPKALLEAMSCELVVIGNNVPGISGVIQSGKTGFLFDADFTHLRSVLQVILEDSSLRKRIGKQARQYIIERFALDKVVAQELGLLEKLTHS